MNIINNIKCILNKRKIERDKRRYVKTILKNSNAIN